MLFSCLSISEHWSLSVTSKTSEKQKLSHIYRGYYFGLFLKIAWLILENCSQKLFSHRLIQNSYPCRRMGITVFEELLKRLALSWFAQLFSLFSAATTNMHLVNCFKIVYISYSLTCSCAHNLERTLYLYTFLNLHHDYLWLFRCDH